MSENFAHIPQLSSPPLEHVAIIMDGNGRWAEARQKPRKFGHLQGVEAVRRCVEAAGDLGIRYLTVYSFSTENWRRPKEEIKTLFDLMRNFVEKDIKKLRANGVRVRILGSRKNLSADIITLIENVERETKDNTRLFFNIAFNYGGRDELTRACAALAREARDGTLDLENLTEADVSRRLDTADMPDPDLVIRTSGEQRLSNFLLWQNAYAEFVTLDVLWPDFSKEDFQEALRIYQSRERRQGAVCA